MAITKIEVPELFDFGSDNSAFKLPTGTTAERPTSPSNGEMRFNTTTGYVEYYDTTDTQWWEIDYEALCTTNDPNYPITNLAYYKMSDASDSGEGSGYIGQGGIFNGSTSHIDFTSPIPYTNTDLTFSCWIKLNSAFSSGFKTIIGAGDKSTGEGIIRLLVRYDSANSYKIEPVRAYSGNSYYTASSSYAAQTINAGSWYNIIYTYSASGNTAKIYINGSLISTTNLTTTSTDSTNSGVLALGQYRDGASSALFWDGSIDQVRIYNTALSSSNVALLYAETSATSSTLNYPVTAAALYELSGNANDTGNTYNGTATNVEYAYNGTATNVNFNVAGKFGNAGEFNGSSSYMTGFPTITNNITISLWFKSPSIPSSSEYLFGETDNEPITYDDYLGCGINSSGQVIASYRPYNSNAPVSITSVGVFADNNWHLVSLTLSTSQLIIYVDGNVVGSATITGTINLPNVSLGAYNSRGNIGSHFNGSIDQIRIFDSALNASQVTQLYNEIQCVPTIVPSENFNTVLYTGNGSTQAITTLDFQPDFTWIKNRNNSASSSHAHALFDSVRTSGYRLVSNTTAAENNYSAYMTGFNSGGFNLSGNPLNDSAGTYVAWNWKAGGAAVSNTDGTITSQVSANVDAGFSIVKYTGNSTAGATVGHGLSKPDLIIFKNLSVSRTSDAWAVYNSIGGATKQLYLESTAAYGTSTSVFNDTEPTANVFSLGNWNGINYSGDAFIAYAFHSVDGFSKIGSYVGTGATGNTIVTGFEPAWVIIKSTLSSGTAWNMWDNKRTPYGMLRANTSDSEFSGPGRITFSTTGFQLLDNDASRNSSGGNYIFMAFAADPT